MIDAFSQFKNVTRSTGLEPPEVIEPDRRKLPLTGGHNCGDRTWLIRYPISAVDSHVFENRFRSTTGAVQNLGATP